MAISRRSLLAKLTAIGAVSLLPAMIFGKTADDTNTADRVKFKVGDYVRFKEIVRGEPVVYRQLAKVDVIYNSYEEGCNDRGFKIDLPDCLKGSVIIYANVIDKPHLRLVGNPEDFEKPQGDYDDYIRER